MCCLEKNSLAVVICVKFLRYSTERKCGIIYIKRDPSVDHAGNLRFTFRKCGLRTSEEAYDIPNWHHFGWGYINLSLEYAGRPQRVQFNIEFR